MPGTRPRFVDIHTHAFNADDIPVRGFLRHVVFKNRRPGRAVARVLDFLLGTGAPGYARENARLDELLASPEESAADLTGLGADARERVAAEAEAALARLSEEQPGVIANARGELARRERADASVELALDPFVLERLARWARLFAQPRLDITSVLLETFDVSVALVCPMLVDLGTSLGQAAGTSMAEQVELHDKISRLSMLGYFGDDRARVHPFVGFDPRRELEPRPAGVPSPFETVQEAVLERGFVGVKLYPPMGWKPLGNDDADVDSVLLTLYQWACENDVPLTAHCNRSQYADEDFADYASPANWRPVLERFGDLHLDLGHFGGHRISKNEQEWPWLIAALATDFDHVYADVGNHDVHRTKEMESYLDMLKELCRRNPRLERRVMLGSDWHMSTMLPDVEEFLGRYHELYRGRFGDAAAEAFAGGTALSFLGFDPGTANATRLAARYAQYAPERTPAWLDAS